jgi:hypothetical protein
VYSRYIKLNHMYLMYLYRITLLSQFVKESVVLHIMVISTCNLVYLWSLADCVVQEGAHTHDHWKNRPPKTATFNPKSMKSFGIQQRVFVFGGRG